ncbi:MAG: hypothetical protein QOJ81_1337 [Chloroflexota bacterium]|jgi:hypothetical protein|nr:hypothetical protein [Chloroflexota bacterium]
MTTEAIETTQIEDQVEPLVSGMLPGLVQRVPELGRIRMGDKSDKGYPIRLRTFRLTSHSKATLESAAALYGGKVEQWKDAPNEGMWELVTERDELDVLVPAMFNVVSQSYEFWQGGTCERRCDGTTEAISGQDCLCAAEGLEGPDRLCDIITRLRVMLPRVPGLGVWRLDTQGYFAATSLPATVQLLARLMPGQWISAVLRAEQRSSKVRLPDAPPDSPTTETHRFVVPVLDIPGTTIGQIVGTDRQTAALPAGDRPTPPTAAEKAAARRAELEAAQAQPATAAERQATADLPLPKGACPIGSPRGDACRKPFGHDGEHQAANKRWPTPEKPDGSRGMPPAQSHGEVEAGAAAAPDLTASARGVFAGEIAKDEPDTAAAAKAKPVSAVVAGENDPSVDEGMRLLGNRPKHGKHL